MLDQIVEQIGGQVATIDVLSPYFDPDGAALSRIAELGAAEVRVMLQPKRADSAGYCRSLARSDPAARHFSLLPRKPDTSSSMPRHTRSRPALAPSSPPEALTARGQR